MVRPIDALDRSIIRLLQEDSRMPSAEIARRLGVAERTVRARINRLVEDGIVKLVAIVNPSALGYDVTADIFLEVEPGRLEEVAQQLVAMEEVAYVGLTTGERDISIQVFVPSVDALYRFITEKLQRIPGVIGTTTYVVPRVLKWLHNWSLPSESTAPAGRRAVRRRRRSRAGRAQEETAISATSPAGANSDENT
ncbi:MAG: Lrp/AsnC family transcriptional regulator [Thermomicrobium sp.]|uniref:Lrp/AsnC family transcriptional regulator n=1 Tax=Thermomicrobium sp. TaxID=1969469 RepID=UPI001B23C68F|nr:Lrp/AsnC family transcriptional regulator [Thermomicrobium sp.]MBO9359849.1 Lrp/AsnC family transcriptional regulator [Thermomicrobium sp.]